MKRVADVVADSSVWIDYLAGRPAPALDDAMRLAKIVLPPIVVAELVSGARRGKDRQAIEGLRGAYRRVVDVAGRPAFSSCKLN